MIAVAALQSRWQVKFCVCILQVICILLCVVLKLAACAIQQKIIGQVLGSRQSIRRMVGTWLGSMIFRLCSHKKTIPRQPIDSSC